MSLKMKMFGVNIGFDLLTWDLLMGQKDTGVSNYRCDDIGGWNKQALGRTSVYSRLPRKTL